MSSENRYGLFAPGVRRSHETGRFYVYFVRAGARRGPVKIGVTANLLARLDKLQTGCPRDLHCLVAPQVPMADARLLESQLHRHFAANRIRGEWFSPTRALEELIERLQFGSTLQEEIADMEVANV
jgi:Meiotically Up-regulated Gene 113 (MUG113) protein